MDLFQKASEELEKATRRPIRSGRLDSRGHRIMVSDRRLPINRGAACKLITRSMSKLLVPLGVVSEDDRLKIESSMEMLSLVVPKIETTNLSDYSPTVAALRHVGGVLGKIQEPLAQANLEEAKQLLIEARHRLGDHGQKVWACNACEYTSWNSGGRCQVCAEGRYVREEKE